MLTRSPVSQYPFEHGFLIKEARPGHEVLTARLLHMCEWWMAEFLFSCDGYRTRFIGHVPRRASDHVAQIVKLDEIVGLTT